MFSLMRLWNEPLSVDVRLWRLRWTTDYFLTCSPRRFTAIQVASRQLTMFNIKDNHTKWYKTIKQQNGPRPMSILLWMTSVQQQTLTGASLFHPPLLKKVFDSQLPSCHIRNSSNDNVSLPPSLTARHWAGLEGRREQEKHQAIRNQDERKSSLLLVQNKSMKTGSDTQMSGDLGIKGLLYQQSEWMSHQRNNYPFLHSNREGSQGCRQAT